MRFEEHIAESKEKFNHSAEPVHRWLDEFMGSDFYKMRHRQLRHHEAGIKEAVEKFGPDAEKHARAHIISDLKQEGWEEGMIFPRNQEHYLKMGLF